MKSLCCAIFASGVACTANAALAKCVRPPGRDPQSLRPLLPGLGDDVIEQAVSHFVQLLTHDYISLYTLLNIDQGRSNSHYKSVVSEELLGKHSVHGLFVLDGVLLSGVFSVKDLRKLVENAFGKVVGEKEEELA